MRKIKNLIIGGIENKVFNLILFTGILITAVFLAVTQYQSKMLATLTAETNARQQTAITEITTDLMDTVVKESMDRTTGLESMIADELFSDLKTRVEMLGEYATKLYANPESAPQMPYAAPDPARNGEILAQLILAEGVDESDPDLAFRLGVAANMSDMMISLFGVSEITNSCFIALPEGAFLVVDDRSASKFEADGSMAEYDPRTRPWYQLAAEKGELIFTDVEVDAFTGDIGIVCAMPVYADGKLTAVVGSDLFLSAMQEAVQASDEKGGYVCIVNRNGHVVFSPKTEGVFRVLDSGEAVDLRQSENAELASLITDALKGKTDVRMVQLEDGTYYMSGAPMETVNWALISAFSQEVASVPVATLQESQNEIQRQAVAAYRSNQAKSRTTITVLMLILTVLLIANALVLGKRIVRPLNNITKRISQLNEQNLEFKMEDSFRTGDEIEVLAESFAMLSHKTVEYLGQVKQVTAEKERVNTELRMANQIQESMLPSIFPAFPERKEFDIYATMEPAKEVGGDFYDFFLIDDDHLCMVMADVSGKGVPAALFMMASKIILQSYAKSGSSASEILSKTNEAICSNNKMGMFVTVWLGILEISTGKLTASNAGHEYPFLMRKGGKFELLKDKHGFVIGGMNGMQYKEYTLQLASGDEIFVYTDGVAEANDEKGELFGTERLTEALNRDASGSCRDLLDSVKDSVDAFVQDAPQFDDTTMLVMRYYGKQAD